MINNDTTHNKDGQTKPATVELNGEVIEATHHITCERNHLLHLYLSARSDGIDITVPLCSDKPAYARSGRGREALGLDTDGGRTVDTVTTGEVREIARKWITGRITTRDIDDVREFGWGDLPGYGFEAGNGTDLVKLPCLEDVEEGDEIPVTAPVEHVPASAPPQMNPATIEDLMDEITGQDEVDGGGSEKQLVTDGGFGIGEVDVGDKVIMRFQGAKYDPWTVESVDGDDVEISRRGFTRSLTRYDLAAFEPRPTVDGFDAPITTGVCAMDGCDKRLEDCEVPVQGYCGPVHAQDDLYDGDFALDTADVAGFSPEVPR